MGGYAGGSAASIYPARYSRKKTAKEKFTESCEGGGSNRVVLFIEQNRGRIAEICTRKWPYIEKEDREQEAMVVLMTAFLHLRMDDGHFWQDYEALLDQHMQARKEDMCSLFRYRYRCRSLDAPLRTKIPGETCTLLHLLSNDGF